MIFLMAITVNEFWIGKLTVIIANMLWLSPPYHGNDSLYKI